MAFDPRHFPRMVVVDTCAVWNILSARKLSLAAFSSGTTFCITPMVNYECLHKSRKTNTNQSETLKGRLQNALNRKSISIQHCELEDLIAVVQLAPSRLSSGELSCIAMSYRISTIAVMTDERLARRFSEEKLNLQVQTTPKLYGWLHYRRLLEDSDHSEIVSEHELFERRPLTEFFNIAYETALQYRLRDQSL